MNFFDALDCVASKLEGRKPVEGVVIVNESSKYRVMHSAEVKV